MNDTEILVQEIIQEIDKRNERQGRIPKLMPATVASHSRNPGKAAVIVDGDGDVESQAMSLIGLLPKDQRVMVLFVPPHGAFVVGEVTPTPWRKVGNPGEPGFAAAWSNTGSPWHDAAYRRVGDCVELRGHVSKASGGGGTTIFQLTSNYVPTNTVVFACDRDDLVHEPVGVSGAGFVQDLVVASGTTVGRLSLDGVRFSVI